MNCQIVPVKAGSSLFGTGSGIVIDHQHSPSHCGCVVAALRASPCGPFPTESEAAPLENHLLVCRKCRDRLEVEIEFVAAMKAAAAKISQGGTGE
jgi:hypothetical protein